jgi:dihydrofolate reductase
MDGGSRSSRLREENFVRNIVVTEIMSLDGVIEEPGWTFPYWNDEIAQFKDVEQQTSDALLLGRVTYEGFATVRLKLVESETFSSGVVSLVYEV